MSFGHLLPVFQAGIPNLASQSEEINRVNHVFYEMKHPSFQSIGESVRRQHRAQVEWRGPLCGVKAGAGILYLTNWSWFRNASAIRLVLAAFL